MVLHYHNIVFIFYLGCMWCDMRESRITELHCASQNWIYFHAYRWKLHDICVCMRWLKHAIASFRDRVVSLHGDHILSYRNRITWYAKRANVISKIMSFYQAVVLSYAPQPLSTRYLPGPHDLRYVPCMRASTQSYPVRPRALLSLSF